MLLNSFDALSQPARNHILLMLCNSAIAKGMRSAIWATRIARKINNEADHDDSKLAIDIFNEECAQEREIQPEFVGIPSKDTMSNIDQAHCWFGIYHTLCEILKTSESGDGHTGVPTSGEDAWKLASQERAKPIPTEKERLEDLLEDLALRGMTMEQYKKELERSARNSSIRNTEIAGDVLEIFRGSSASPDIEATFDRLPIQTRLGVFRYLEEKIFGDPTKRNFDGSGVSVGLIGSLAKRRMAIENSKDPKKISLRNDWKQDIKELQAARPAIAKELDKIITKLEDDLEHA